METKLLDEMRAAANNGELRELSISDFPNIVGKRIQTIYFGYAGQDGVDDFIVDRLVSLWDLAARDDFRNIDPRYSTRQEYWKSYMSKEQIAEKQQCLTILSAEGRDTYIMFHQELGNDKFTCSDADRVVLFRIVE